MNKKVFVFSVMLALCICTMQAFAAVKMADVDLSFEKNAFASDEGVTVKVTISNPNKGAIRVLRWATPLDGVTDDLFRVSVNGKNVEYIGAHYKRPAPTDKDYVILRGGESISENVDLSRFYDMTETGYYEIAYNAESYLMFTKNPTFMDEEGSLLSNAKAVFIAGRDNKLPETPQVDNVVGSTSFAGCSSSNQSALNTARDNAYNYSVNSFDYLNAGTIGSRYTTWFGSYTSSRYNTVRGNFQKIRDAMNNASVTFNCGCTSSAYAYVYSNQPYTIYLCNAFWSAPATGTDSKAGTLVHEMSHFSVVAGTSDYAYGQTNAKKLASSNPKRAIANADNHEYFAENTPSLP